MKALLMLIRNQNKALKSAPDIDHLNQLLLTRLQNAA